MKNLLTGNWRIVEMEQWDQDYVDLAAPGHVTLKKGGTGELHFGAVDEELDWCCDRETAIGLALAAKDRKERKRAICMR